MSKRKYKLQIEEAMKSLGTYREEFDLAIDSLADIMENRDKAFKEWKKSGGEFIVKGEKMDRTHPLLKEWKDLNTQTLAYMKELSLTHQAMKRRAEATDAIRKQKPTLFDAMIDIMEN